jgi:hypothetical protein
MQTMNRESMTTAAALGFLVGLVVAALVALTGTGVPGLYAFGIPSGLAGVIFMGWSDVRERFSGGQRQPVDNPRHIKRRHSQHRVDLP